MNLFQDEETTRRINVFDWDKEFPDIFDKGGFDVVIGNPPYFRISSELTESVYLRYYYKTCEFKVDIYTLFIERFINLGFKKLGFIIPNTLLTNQFDRKLRKLILEKSNIYKIVNYRIRVFEKAVVHSLILILDNEKKFKKLTFRQISKEQEERIEINQDEFLKTNDYSFNIRFFGNDFALFNKIKEKSILLSEICYIRQCIKTGDDSKYLHSKPILANFKPVLGGKEIGRYVIKYGNRFVDYGKHLACPRDPYIFEVQEKILIRETGKRVTATFDNNKYYLLSSIYSVFLRTNLAYNLKYILGVINSKISQYFMKKLCFDNSSGAFIKARIFHYKQLLVPKLSFENISEKEKHDSIVDLVDSMLETQKKYHSAKIENEKSMYEKQIDILDNQIDTLVYELYGLTEEEIKIVEGGK
jgi:hypothetical protein